MALGQHRVCNRSLAYEGRSPDGGVLALRFRKRYLDFTSERPTKTMTEKLQARVRSSVRVSLVGALTSGLIQFVTMAVLARLLGPTDYGFFVVALSVNALSVQFVSSAAERAMVVEADATSLHGRGVAVALCLLGVAVTTLAVSAAIKWASGWQIDLRVLSLVLAGQALAGLGSASRALLRRSLRFGAVIGSEITGLLLGNLGTGVMLAWLGFGPFALALAQSVQFIVTAGWMLAMAPEGAWPPRFDNLGALPKTFIGVMKPTTLEAVNGQVAPLAVSAVLGAVSLGLYNRLYSVITFPVQMLVSSANRALFSSLATVAEDDASYRNGVRLLVRAAAAIITPLSMGLAGASYSFVAVVLGPKWLSAAAIVPFLALAVWGTMYGGALGQSAEVRARFNERAMIQALTTGVLVVAVLLGSRWGLGGVAAGTMASCLLYAFLNMWLAAKMVDENIRVVVRWSLPGLAAGITCFSMAHLIQWMAGGMLPVLTLAMQVAVSAIVTLLTLFFLDREILRHALMLVVPRRIVIPSLTPSSAGGMPSTAISDTKK